MPDVEVTVTTNPIDVYINSDPTVYVNTATEGIQGPPLDSGVFVQRSETGLFYPNDNPSGFDSLPNATQEFQVVKWDGNQWIAAKIAYSELVEQPAPSPGGLLPVGTSNGQVIKWDSYDYKWYPTFLNTNDIKDLSGLFSGLLYFYKGFYAGYSNNAYDYTFSVGSGTFNLNNFSSYGGYGGYGYGQVVSPAIQFVNNSIFNLYGSGQTAIKLYEKLITGFENISATNIYKNGYPVISTNETGALLQNYFRLGGNTSSQALTLGTVNNYDLNISTNNKTRLSVTKGGVIDIGGTGSEKILIDTTIKGFPQIRWSGTEAGKGSRLSSREGGGYYVTLDREDGTPENLNVAGNLQVGSGSGIQTQRLYVRGNALITTDLTVNTSGNFVSGLFINRRPVLTGVLNSGSGIRLASGTRNNDLILKNISGKNNITVSETGNLINVQLNDTIYAANQLAEINLLSREITNFDFRSAVFNVLPLSNQVYLSDFNLAEEGQEFVPFNFVPGQAFDLTPSGKNGVISLYKETGLISGFIIDSPQILINGTDILDLVSFSGEISNLESMISGLSGYSESTYATKNEINTLSGILTGDYATKQYVVDSINTLSGNLTFVNYKYILTAGYDEYEVTFPQPFIQAPRTIMVQMENEEYNIIYAYDVYGITASGFSVKFSDILAETNNLMVLAKA